MLSFEMNEQEEKDAEELFKEHDKDCPLVLGNIQSTIGGRISYTFTPTGLGMACGVRCACGWSQECTDVSCW